MQSSFSSGLLKLTKAARRVWRRIWPAVLLVAVIIILIQWLTDSGVIRHFVLPRPSDVAMAFVREWPVMKHVILSTMKAALSGFWAAAALAVLSALLMDRFLWVSDAFYPLIVITQTLPTLVITPVIVLLFGYGDFARFFTVILVCFFPVTISLLHGLRAVDADLIRLMRTMGARERAILYHVKIPASAPALFSGLKIAATYSIMAAVLAEWAGGGEGLGIYMLRTKRAFRFDAMFASIIWIVVLSLLLYQTVIGIEKVTTPWRRGQARR
jgi:ABC-type nitrate/sulfonate/bicarbonate transport system permease component